MRIAVCLPQVPFQSGGAEILARELRANLEQRGHQAELVTVPFKWYPNDRVLTEPLLWRLLDLTEANGEKIDLVIGTKFPSYAVRHPNKIVWLVHQFRQAYELDGTALGQFGPSPEDRATLRGVQRLDRRALGEARRRFAISDNVAKRLEGSTGLDAEVLRPPPQPLPYRCDEYGDFVLSVGRLDAAKRVDLLLEAAAAGTGTRVVVAGDGPDRARLEQLAATLGLDGRVSFGGRVTPEQLTDLYATCLAVYYAPVDEDLGLVPYEAFLAQKPVVTTEDAGGPLEAVRDGETGRVVAADPQALADALAWIDAHREEAREWGVRGKSIAEQLTWDHVVDRLLAA
jgi:glycosyltransferase involved in cell wall biosynthesis